MTDQDDESADSRKSLLDLATQGDPKETVLTEKQRRYLRGYGGDISGSNERSVRRRIRRRLKNSWIDSAIAFEHLSPEECAQLTLRRQGNTAQLQDYSGVGETGPPELKGSFLLPDADSNLPILATGGLRQVFALSFLSLHQSLVEELGYTEDEYLELMELLVAGALQDSFAKCGRVTKIDVEIDVQDVEGNELPAEADTVGDLRLRYAARESEPADIRVSGANEDIRLSARERGEGFPAFAVGAIRPGTDSYCLGCCLSHV